MPKLKVIEDAENYLKDLKYMPSSVLEGGEKINQARDIQAESKKENRMQTRIKYIFIMNY